MSDNEKCIYDKDYEKMEYAWAYVKPQKYENLFTCKEALCKGTIFKDLAKVEYDCWGDMYGKK